MIPLSSSLNNRHHSFISHLRRPDLRPGPARSSGHPKTPGRPGTCVAGLHQTIPRPYTRCFVACGNTSQRLDAARFVTSPRQQRRRQQELGFLCEFMRWANARLYPFGARLGRTLTCVLPEQAMRRHDQRHGGGSFGESHRPPAHADRHSTSPWSRTRDAKCASGPSGYRSSNARCLTARQAPASIPPAAATNWLRLFWEADAMPHRVTSVIGLPSWMFPAGMSHHSINADKPRARAALR